MTRFRQQQAKRIIIVFLVLTLVSSLSAAASVIGNMNLAFAKKSSGGGGSGSRNDKGSPDSSSSSDKGSDNGGGGGTDNGGGGDTSNTSTPPSATEGNTPTTKETTPPPAAEENTAAPSPPPAAENQQQPTCPGGAAPDANGKCPAPTSTTTPTTQDGGHILVMSNPDGSCPAGSHKFPGSQVCEKDTVPPTSGNGGTGGTTTTQPGGTGTGTTPATTQGGHILVMSNPDGSCPAGSHKFPGSQVCEKDTATTSSGGGQVPPECQGIIAGPKDKCSSSPATSPINGAPQTLTQQTCPPLPIDANGRCPGVDMRGGGLGLPPVPPPQPTPIGDGSFQLPTVPPVPNTNTIAPICPSGSHLELNKCVVDGVQCPSGTVQDGDKCTPSSDGSAAAGGAQPRPTCGPDAPGAACQAAKAAANCPQSATLDASGKCIQTGPGGLPLPQRTCPAGSNLDPTTRNCNPTTGGNTASQYVSAVNGKCPAGSHEAGGSSGNAGQPGTGSIICRLDSPPPATPPATPPTNTPPVQPQATQQLTPSQPECEPGFHWDISQLKCV